MNKHDFFNAIRNEISLIVFEELTINDCVLKDEYLNSYFENLEDVNILKEYFKNESYLDILDHFHHEDFLPEFCHYVQKQILTTMGRNVVGDADPILIHQSSECRARFNGTYSLTESSTQFCECCYSKTNLNEKTVPFLDGRGYLDYFGLDCFIVPKYRENINFKTEFIAFDQITICENCVKLILTPVKTTHEIKESIAV